MPRAKKEISQDGAEKRRRGRPPLGENPSRAVVKKKSAVRGKAMLAEVKAAVGRPPEKTRAVVAKERAMRQKMIHKEKQKALKKRIKELAAQVAAMAKAVKKEARSSVARERVLARMIAAKDEAFKKFETKWARRYLSQAAVDKKVVTKKKVARRKAA